MKVNLSRQQQQSRQRALVSFIIAMIDVVWRIVKNPKQLPKVVFLVMGIQCIWWLYDRNIMSQVHHKPPKIYPKPTESSPLTPYYLNTYTGPFRQFSVQWSSGTTGNDDNHPWCDGPLMPQTSIADKSPINEGMIFVKMARASPTNIQEDVTTRIARNVATKRRKSNSRHNLTSTTTLSCTARIAALKARRWNQRIRDKSFLWTSIKEPASRLVDTFFELIVSYEQAEPTIENFFRYISDNEIIESTYYFKILTLRKQLNTFRTDLYPQYTQEILDGFDFIGITERPYESLAVLQLLLGLETNDMLYLLRGENGNVAGNTTDFTRQYADPPPRKGEEKIIYYKRQYPRQRKQDKCIAIHPNPLEQPNIADRVKLKQQIKEWFWSEEAESYLEGDILLYRAVNQSLDTTIEKLGASKVDETIQQLKKAEKIVFEKCAEEVKYPCTNDGQISTQDNCLALEIGCGYRCLDSIDIAAKR